LIALQTSYFDWNFHDRTADFSARKLRVDAAADVQMNAYEFQMENPLAL